MIYYMYDIHAYMIYMIHLQSDGTFWRCPFTRFILHSKVSASDAATFTVLMPAA